MLARVSRAVIHRLNYPKREAARMSRAASLRAKLRPLLSQWDCEEVHQTCALQLHASGALYRDKVQLSDWINCFRACRVLLRIDRRGHEDATDVATLDTMPQLVDSPDRFTARRSAIARKVRYQRACIAAAFTADKSRQRKHNRAKAARVLRFVASWATAHGLAQADLLESEMRDSTALRVAIHRFRTYTATGEAILEREAAAHVAERNATIQPRNFASALSLALAAT